MKPEINVESEEQSPDVWYDFFSPLWFEYYKEIRKTVKFPRGYREISSINTPDLNS